MVELGDPDQLQKCLVEKVQMRGKKHKSEVEIEGVIWMWVEIVTPLVLAYGIKFRPPIPSIRYGVVANIAVSHTAAGGSIPPIGVILLLMIWFCISFFFLLKIGFKHALFL